MKIRWIVFIAILTVIALGACSSGASTEVPASAEESNLPLVQQEDQDVYPAPESEAAPEEPAEGDAYPVFTSAEYTSGLYPDTSESTEVTWEEARVMIINGEVLMVRVVGESPTDVTLGLKDGRLIVTVAIDQLVVVNAIRECGTTCNDIVMHQE